MIDYIKIPSKEDQKTALESYDVLASALEEMEDRNPEIEIEETQEKIRVPLNALKLLAKILKETSKGNPISVVPIAIEMTTQAASELLGCSRPHLVKLLEEGKIPFSKVGKHRRVRYEDVVKFKIEMKVKQERLISEIMDADEEAGLYDT